MSNLTTVEYAGTLAACLDNDNYFVIIEDTNTSCQSNTMNVFATEHAIKSSKSADNDYLVIIDEGSYKS